MLGVQSEPTRLKAPVAASPSAVATVAPVWIGMDSEFEYDSAQLKMGCRPAGILIHPPLTLFFSSLPLGLRLLGFLAFPSEPSPCLAGRNMPSFPSHLHCATTLALEILLVVLLIRLLVDFINWRFSEGELVFDFRGEKPSFGCFFVGFFGLLLG